MNETPTQYYERMRQARQRYVRFADTNGQRRTAQQRDATRRQNALAEARRLLADT